MNEYLSVSAYRFTITCGGHDHDVRYNKSNRQDVFVSMLS